MAKHVVPIVAGAVALSLVGGGIWAAKAFATKDVTLSVDGSTKQVAVHAKTVKEVLAAQKIVLGARDLVQPSVDTPVENGLKVSVRFARPLEVVIDGTKKVYWVTATNVADALTQLKINTGASDKLSTSRSAGIDRRGLSLSIVTAKHVKVDVAGKPTEITLAGTVKDALTKVGVSPDNNDIVSPSLDTPLTEGAQISFTKVDVKTTTRNIDIPFSTTKQNSADLYIGDKKVATKGASGSAIQTLQQVFKNEKLVSEKVISTDQKKAPVSQVELIGSKPKPKPAAPAPSASSSSAPSKSASTSSSSRSLAPATGATCQASYYWQGQRTANGEWFNTNDFTAAHKSLPFNSKVKVTNLANGKTTVVRINDRGPYISGRCLDLSRAAMSAIGGTGAGVIRVSYQVL